MLSRRKIKVSDNFSRFVDPAENKFQICFFTNLPKQETKLITDDFKKNFSPIQKVTFPIKIKFQKLFYLKFLILLKPRI